MKINDEQTSLPASRISVQGEDGVSAIKGEMALAQLAEHFDLHPTRSRNGSSSFWKWRRSVLVLMVATEQGRSRWM